MNFTAFLELLPFALHSPPYAGSMQQSDT